MNFTPSLVLLIFKIILIFILSFYLGYSFILNNFKEKIFIQFTLSLGLGVSLLIVSELLSSIAGFPGKYGLIFPFFCLVFNTIKNKNRFNKLIKDKSYFFILILFVILGSALYISPFIIKNTSGFYARGGGDHSSYLTLSEYYSDNPIWREVTREEKFPTSKAWMTNSFVSMTQDFRNGGTVANQFIAAPFISILPGSTEETYSAVVAIYFSLAGLSYLCILIQLTDFVIKKNILFSTLFFVNPILLYISDCQSIPFLIGLALMNFVLTIFIFNIKNNHWEIDTSFFTISLIAGCLLMIYPHLYALGILLGIIIIISLKFNPFQSKVIKFFIFFLFATFLITNWYLLLSLRLILLSPLLVADAVSNYSQIDILSFWTGVKDFSFQQIDSNKILKFIMANSLYLYIIIFSSIILTYSNYKKKVFYLLSVLLFFFLSLIYNHNQLSYQATRIIELGHPFLLSLLILSLSELKEKSFFFKYFSYSIFILFLSLFLFYRSYVVLEIVKNKGSHLDFQDNSQLKIINIIKHLQANTNERILYYFGRGNGVETSGISILFREINFLIARGFTYSIIENFQQQFSEKYKINFSLYDKSLLQNSIHLKLKRPDIIIDERITAKIDSLYETERLVLYDTINNPYTSELVGEYWNDLLDYDGNKKFRYLKGNESAIVIWSGKKSDVNVEITLHSDISDVNVKIDSESFKSSIYHSVEKWERNFSEKNKLILKLVLEKGPNIILLKPVHKEGKNSWLMIWEIKIKDR